MFENNDMEDILRYLAGFLVSLQLLLKSFGFEFFNNEQIDAVVNVASFLFILYFGAKHNYLGKKGQAQKALLQKAGLEKSKKTK
ncbi:phage holin [Gottfriedia sp. OAE603]|uniref:phage holin n=1 Tax=Gottfriedia sp. OAE603 TaxID=2663872 RepID=UPI00178A68F3